MQGSRFPRKRVKAGFRGRCRALEDFEFAASLLCATGAALQRVALISWQCLGAWVQMWWQALQFEWSDHSSCGVVRILSAQSAHVGRVESLSLLRGARFKTRDVARDATRCVSQKRRSEVLLTGVDYKSCSTMPRKSVVQKCISEV